jgi:Flp pilus assembly protein TadD
MKSKSFAFCTRLSAIALVAMLGACGMLGKQNAGYGMGAQADREAALERTSKQSALPDSPGMYLALIDKMQSEGMYYASLAHIDAYEKRYGRSQDSSLRRADALRQTDQLEASRTAYESLLKTPLAARGYRGLGLLSGQAGHFDEAAKQFERASELEPTDASILSDLGYARMRAGAVEAARVPLMKASELARNNPKIQKNLVLFLFASGQTDAARRIMKQEQYSDDAQRAMDASVKQVLDAANAANAAKVAPSKAEAVAAAAPEHSSWRSFLDAAKSLTTASKNTEAVATTAP